MAGVIDLSRFPAVYLLNNLNKTLQAKLAFVHSVSLSNLCELAELG